MPDRDVIPNLPHRKWAPACRLFASQDDMAVATRAAERALAASLRRDPPRIPSRDDFDLVVQQRLAEGLFGPARAATLRAVGIDETSRRQNALLAQMAPAIDHFYDQVAAGKSPRTPQRRKLTPEETLLTRIPTLTLQRRER